MNESWLSAPGPEQLTPSPQPRRGTPSIEASRSGSDKVPRRPRANRTHPHRARDDRDPRVHSRRHQEQTSRRGPRRWCAHWERRPSLPGATPAAGIPHRRRGWWFPVTSCWSGPRTPIRASSGPSLGAGFKKVIPGVLGKADQPARRSDAGHQASNAVVDDDGVIFSSPHRRVEASSTPVNR